jgi:uncharacterized protein HemX
LPEAPEPSPATEAVRPRRATWLLVAAALVCAVGWGVARHRSGQLQEQLAVAQDELSGARARLAVLEAQRSEVHAQLKALSTEADALAGRLAELEGLVAGDRAGATDAQLPRSEPGSPD